MPRAILRTPFLPIMNLLSSNSYLRPLKLLVDMFSKARTYKYLYLFMKVWTLSTMYSLCYLSLGLVLVKETSLFLLASGINNYKFDYINSKSHYKNLRKYNNVIRSINKNKIIAKYFLYRWSYKIFYFRYSMMLKAKSILSFVGFSKNVMVEWLVLVWDVDDTSWGHLQSCLRNVQWRALAWFWKHDLNVFSVKFCIVVSQFGSFEVFVQEVADFFLGNWQKAQKIFITMIVGWDIQRRSMAVEKIFEVGSNVVHAVNDCSWELNSGGFNCDFSVVEDTVVSCGKSTVLVWWVDEVDFDVSWKSAGLALGFVDGLIIFWQNNEKFKELFVNTADFGSCQEIVDTWNDILECELDLICVFSRSKRNDVIILSYTFLSSVVLSGFSD